MLVETHSEYMVLRLLRRIRETGRKRPPEGLELTPRDLRVYYASRSGASTSLKAIDIDTDGELVDPWPDDFFEQDFKERFS
jgi:predicted ATPase